MKVDLERAPALGICCDCEEPRPLSRGRCEVCGSSSIVRSHSLGSKLWNLAPSPKARDPKFYRRRVA